MDLRLGPVAVVGAGWAGLAAAVELAHAGRRVELFEAARQPGGRARRVRSAGVDLDNGQHILLGAYRETLRLMALVGAAEERLLARRPLELTIPGRFSLRAPRWLPAPLHLLAALVTARGIGAAAKLAAARFMVALARSRYRVDPAWSVADLLHAHRQPQAVCEFLWQPLCIAALNTAPADASAQVFANVLADAFARGRSHSDLLIPRVDLGAVFPDPACAYLENRSARLRFGHAIDAIVPAGGGVRLISAAGSFEYAAVVCALPAARCADVFAGDDPASAALRATLAAIFHEPIVTCYLQYPAQVRLASPMQGMVDGIGQWVFDKGALGAPAGLLAVVVSAAARLRGLPANELAALIDAELRALWPSLPPPLWHRVITEKRATFRCSPGLARPRGSGPVPGAFLAGDHVENGYPATLEGAVRNGVAAARAALGWLDRTPAPPG